MLSSGSLRRPRPMRMAHGLQLKYQARPQLNYGPLSLVERCRRCRLIRDSARGVKRLQYEWGSAYRLQSTMDKTMVMQKA